MVIEWLQFRVDEDARELFVQQDNAIWTTALSQYPGFIDKEVWMGADHPTEVVCVVRWETMDRWKSIPLDELDAIEAKFKAAVGDRYELLASNAYQVQP